MAFVDDETRCRKCEYLDVTGRPTISHQEVSHVNFFHKGTCHMGLNHQ